MADQFPRKPKNQHIQDIYRGCLIGGAVGDALGAPVEFMSRDQIIRKFGTAGIQEYVAAFGKLGAITDDTQMTLFTAEGLMRGWLRGNLRGICYMPGVIARSYQRWYHTQGHHHPMHDDGLDGWLISHRELFSCRAPGNTCLSGLESMLESNDVAKNDSKGCGGVIRVAPIGMYYAILVRSESEGHDQAMREAFELACQAAAITHGHPTGQLASGTFAAIVMKLLVGVKLPQAIDAAIKCLIEQPDHEETLHAIQHACRLALETPNDADALAQLGGGWIAEEALAIAVYCALSAKDFRSGVTLAVNHSGDSDSTGSIAGQLLGAIHGAHLIPPSWTGSLELRQVIEEMADDLATLEEWNLEDETSTDEVDYYSSKYPGW
ncbi:MAG: ADP-ribosylglycohydrolase family protein [Rhodoferax sp.]|nr:ADP-ribosylglycohydrolase family protein [Rhodoferax sp.]